MSPPVEPVDPENQSFVRRFFGVFRGSLLHGFRCIERKGIGRDHRFGLWNSGQRPGSLLAGFAFEIPQRTVYRVARGAGRQQSLQQSPVSAGLQRLGNLLYGIKH